MSTRNGNGYVKEAKRILTFAKKEYAGAKKTKNEMKARQAAEKGYLCLLKTVNALFIKNGVKPDHLPIGERGRLHFLGRYADREFRKSYNDLYKAFHIDAFHEGIVLYKELDESFEDLEALVRELVS